MKLRPELDFARRQSAAGSGARRLWAAAALLLGLAAGWASWQVQALDQAQRGLSAARLAREAALAAPVRALADAPGPEAAVALAIQTALARRWDAWFDALERAREPLVVVDQLRADAQDGRFGLTARASDHATVTRFVERLTELPAMKDVVLVQSDPWVGDRLSVRFVVSARWTGGGP